MRIVDPTSPIAHALTRHGLSEPLREHALVVFAALPAAVRDDLLDDESFLICQCPTHGGGEVRVGSPARGRGARSVVLKDSLAQRPDPFIRWLIAHELAHAHLRNEGRFPGEDPELAADALAAQWGFPKPHQP